MTLVKKKGCGALYSQACKIRRKRHLHILLEQLRKIECAQSHILCHFSLCYIIGKILNNIVTCGMDISPSGLGCFLKLRKILILGHHIFTKLKQDIIDEHLASGLGEMVRGIMDILDLLNLLSYEACQLRLLKGRDMVTLKQKSGDRYKIQIVLKYR